VIARRLLNCREVAELLGLKEPTIRLWIAQRRFPIVRLGRAVRIPIDALDEMIRSNTTPALEDRL